MIHVCLCLHDKTGRYSKLTGTAMLSLLENHITPPPRRLPSITVHILHDNTLTQDNRDKFIYLAGQYGQRVEFHNVEELCADRIAEIRKSFPTADKTSFTIAAFYRFFIPELLPADVEKAIYLDSDIIVNLDITELWQIELDDKPLGVITEISNGYDSGLYFALCRDGIVKVDDYFNSGVLLINLKIFRSKEKEIIDALKFIGERHGYYDQDTLNYCFATQALKLPTKFNRFVWSARMEKNARAERKIYHYTYKVEMNMHDPFYRLWMRHFMKTPWFNEETIGRLYAGVQNLHVGLKQSMVNLSAAMSGKTRGFFILPNDVGWLKNFFSIRDDEEIITVENQDSLKKLLDAMNASRGRKIFFILVPNFPLQILTQAGFAPGRDFFNGFEFFSEAQGVPLNSWPLIKAM